MVASGLNSRVLSLHLLVFEYNQSTLYTWINRVIIRNQAA